MNKPLMMVAAALAFLPAAAIAAPDFSGTWARDRAASDPDPYPIYRLARPPQGAENAGAPDGTLNVKQAGGKLETYDINRPGRSYMLDGKPHMMATDTGMQQANVTATLRDDGLLIAATQPYGGMPGNIGATVTESWTLSPDGKTLTITTVRDTPAEKRTVKSVYTKK